MRAVRPLLFLLLPLVAEVAAAQSILTIAGGGTLDGRPATAGGLRNANDLVFDSAGNLFISDPGDHRVRRVDAATGIITTVAGNGGKGFSGDGGPATVAGLDSPRGVAVDSSGNLFVADSSHRVRRIDAETGIITTVVGGRLDGPIGEDGPATAARLYFPDGIAFDAAGDLYIADTGNHAIRRVSFSTGLIQRVAGGGGDLGDGGPATLAELENPTHVAFDAGGNLYIADTLAQRVRRVDQATGIISTVAGSGTKGFSGDGGPATAATFYDPFRIALGPGGDLYICDRINNRVRRVDAVTGTIVTVSGNGEQGYSGDGGPATQARLNWPTGLAFDAAGHLYIGCGNQPSVRKVDRTTGIITTVAGNGQLGFLGDGGLAVAGGLKEPRGVAVDSEGNVYISDTLNHRVRRVDAKSGIISTFAGGGTREAEAIPATEIVLSSPYGVTLDSSGNLYIADKRNSRIRKVSAATGLIQTVAGNGTTGYSGDGGPATRARLNWPYAVAVDTTGNLYIADTWNDRIRKVQAGTGVITTVAGRSDDGYVVDDGIPATTSSITRPQGIAVDASGDLYIAEQGLRIRKVTSSTGVINTLVGTTAIEFPAGMAIGNGSLYFADEFAQLVRKVPITGGVVSTATGRGQTGGIGNGVYSGDGGPAREAGLSDPFAVALDSSGNLFIADALSARIRVVYACIDVVTPSLKSPADASSGITTSPSLTWEPVRGAFRYDVYLGTDPSSLTLIAEDVGTTAVSPANLELLTTYFWRVVAKGDPYCSPPRSSTSVTRSFTTASGCQRPSPFE